MRKILRYLGIFSIVAAATMGSTAVERADAHAGRLARSVQVGIASWYGPQHQGRPTASGEIFDMKKLTAAHPTLPLASKARVTNLENGKSVEVKINDRGPYVDGRIIDLSERAARRLGMKEQGLARVRVERVGAETDG
jgi:rare lipoprotein A